MGRYSGVLFREAIWICDKQEGSFHGSFSSANIQVAAVAIGVVVASVCIVSVVLCDASAARWPRGHAPVNASVLAAVASGIAEATRAARTAQRVVFARGASAGFASVRVRRIAGTTGRVRVRPKLDGLDKGRAAAAHEHERLRLDRIDRGGAPHQQVRADEPEEVVALMQ